MLDPPYYELAVAVGLALVANGAPVLASRIVPHWLAVPVDQGLVLRDGRRLLGESKSWRGIGAAVLVTALAAALFGLSWQLGAAAGLAAMAGDLASSFIKRRLGMASGDMALGLDQFPEALFPTLVLMGPLGLSAGQALLAVLLFFVIGIPLSLLLFRLGLRKRRL